MKEPNPFGLPEIGAADRVAFYIHSVRRGLRREMLVRGAGLTLGAALLLTLIAVPAADQARFSVAAVRWARLLLLGGTALAGLAWVLLPALRKWSDAHIARFIEGRHPEFRNRLSTAVEIGSAPAKDPIDAALRELLIEDTVRATAVAPAESFLDPRRMQRFAAIGAGSLIILLALALFGPTMFRFGARHLWAGWMETAAGPLYRLDVKPGDLKVARNTNQAIVARPRGFQPSGMRLMAYYQSGTRWEEVPMRPSGPGGEFAYTLEGVRETIRYYVEASGVRSPEFKLTVGTAPKLKRLEITYSYPSFTGLKPVTEKDGADIRAVRGTRVEVVAFTEADAGSGDLLLESGAKIELRPDGDGRLRGSFSLEESGLYHVRLLGKGDEGPPMRASDDYIMEAQDDQPPVLYVKRPGRDSHPSSIEEVTTHVEATDDFGLRQIELRYSINGGPEKPVNLMPASAGGKTVTGTHTFFLEDHKLEPGDLVSYYAVAKDVNRTVKSDIYFMDVRPFDREYRQSQMAGGGGAGAGQGQGDDSAELVERQKEIISATHNLLREGRSQGEDVKTLANIQRTLKAQTEMLATRMQRRELAGVNKEFTAMVENLKKAAEAMGPAAEQLAARKLQEALPPEQRALQHLARAEAAFREIQVAFGQQGGGGGGRSGASRDLRSLFDLELDTSKNQYETPQQRRENAGDNKLDETLRRLQELARRQQQLADQRNREQQQPAASRWEQEKLRRETEEMARQLEQLARQTGSREFDTIRQRLEQAARDMQASSQGQAGQSGQQSGRSGQSGSEAARQRALQRLQEARDMLARKQGDQSRQALDRAGQQAQRLAQQQQDIADTVRRGTQNRDQRQELTQEVLEKKSELFEGINKLEQQLHEAARQLGSSQPEASRSTRAAADSIRQDRLQDRVRQGYDFLRRGLDELARDREDALQRSMDSLAQQIGDLQRNLQARGGEPGQSGQNGRDQRLQRALANVEDMRRRLEAMDRQGGNRGQQQGGQRGQQQAQGGREPGQQPGGQQQGGQQSGQQSAQAGQQGGQQGAQGQRGQGGDSAGGARGGTRDPDGRNMGGQPWGARGEGYVPPSSAANPGIDRPWDRNRTAPLTPEERRQLQREYGEILPLARGLEREVGKDEEFWRSVREMVDKMKNLEAGRFPGDPAEVERIRAGILDGLRQVELEISRRLAESGGLRLPAHEEIPDKYRREVEQYYRSLAQRQQPVPKKKD